MAASSAGPAGTEQAVAGGASLEAVPVATAALPTLPTLGPTVIPTPRGNHGKGHGNGKGKEH